MLVPLIEIARRPNPGMMVAVLVMAAPVVDVVAVLLTGVLVLCRSDTGNTMAAARMYLMYFLTVGVFWLRHKSRLLPPDSVSPRYG